MLGVEGEEPASGSEAAVGFLHGVDGAHEMFEGVVGSEHADFAVAERPTLVDASAIEVDGLRHLA